MNRFRPLFILGTILFVAYLTFTRALPAHAQVITDAPQPPRPTDPPPTPDPRWIALVKGETEAVRAPQVITPTINLNLTDGYVAGRVALPNPVYITVTRDGVNLYSRVALPTLDIGGYFYIASLRGWSDYGYYDFQADDVAWLTQAATTISLTIPALTTSTDTRADIVYGTAPVSAMVELMLYSVATADVITQTTLSNSLGRYQITLSPTVDLRPRDMGYLIYRPATTQQVYVRFTAPYARVQLGGSNIVGQVTPNTYVELVVTNALGTRVRDESALARQDGQFDFSGCCNRVPYKLQASDTLSLTFGEQTLTMTLFPLTVQADRARGQLNGLGPNGQRLTAWTLSGPLDRWASDVTPEGARAQATVTISASGLYTVALPLQPADYGAVSVATPEGLDIYTRFALPYVRLRVGPRPQTYYGYDSPSMLSGQIAEAQTPLTLTVQGVNGYLKGRFKRQSDDTGYFVGLVDDYRPEIARLDLGDQITVATASGLPLTLTVPHLIAHLTALSDTVTGQAPPGGPVSVAVWDWDDTDGWWTRIYEQVVTATQTGDFVTDFNLPNGFSNRAFGEARYHTAEGYQVLSSFGAERVCQPQLDWVQVGGNRLNFTWDNLCPMLFTVRLRDAHGQLKVTQSGWYEPFELQDAQWRPVPILPGDVIELESITTPATATPGGPILPTPAFMPTPQPTAPAAAVVVTVSVPELTLQVGTDQRTLYGTAPPGIVVAFDALAIDNYDLPSFWSRLLTHTVGAQGLYTVSLSGEQSLARGDLVRATIAVAGQTFFAQDRVPLMALSLYQGEVDSWLTPLTPYTLTLQTPQFTSALQITGYADADGVMQGRFYQDTGRLWEFHPGEQLTLTTPVKTWSIVLPEFSAAIDLTHATLFGQAPPNTPLWVTAYPDRWRWGGEHRTLTTTANGYYTATFNMAFSLATHGESHLWVEPDLQLTLETFYSFWRVKIGSACVGLNLATATAPGNLLRLALETAAGVVKEWNYMYRTTDLTQYITCFDTATVQPTDQLTALAPTGPLTFTVPTLLTQYDYRRQALTGQVAPFSQVGVIWPTPNFYFPEFRRSITADAQGNYGLDVSDLDWRIGETYYILAVDAQGNYIQQAVKVLGYPLYFPLLSK